MGIPPASLSDLLGMVRSWVEARVQASSLDEAESLARQVSQAVGQVVVQGLAAQVSGPQSYEGSSIECSCGRRARFVGYRERAVTTLCGDVQVSRSYYHCEHCHQGHLPWDEAQGLNERLWSPGVKALVAEVASRLSYHETTLLLYRAAGLRVEESSAEAIVAEVGSRARAAEAATMGMIESGEPLPSEAPAP